jgi:hypothetical protein
MEAGEIAGDCRNTGPQPTLRRLRTAQPSLRESLSVSYGSSTCELSSGVSLIAVDSAGGPTAHTNGAVGLFAAGYTAMTPLRQTDLWPLRQTDLWPLHAASDGVFDEPNAVSAGGAARSGSSSSRCGCAPHRHLRRRTPCVWQLQRSRVHRHCVRGSAPANPSTGKSRQVPHLDADAAERWCPCSVALKHRRQIDTRFECRDAQRRPTLAVLSALELQALYALLVPLGAHAPGTAHRSHD